MDNQFTTTFIPKKPLVVESTDKPISRPVGILSSLSLVLFIIMIAISGAVYAWEKYQINQNAALEESVAKTQKEFEPELIAKLQRVDKQLRNASILMKKHIAISPVFDLLELTALKQVQYSKIDIAFEKEGYKITMSGAAQDYETLAQQSQVLGASSYLRNILFSNFLLNQFGKVNFDLAFETTPEFFNFQTAPLSPSMN